MVESRGRRLLHKRRRGGSSVQAASSEESSSRRPAQLRMDPWQSNVGEGSQGQIPGGNIGAYQPGWNPYIYWYQPPPGWFPPGFQPRPPNVPMMNPSGCAPEGFRPAEIPEASVHHSEADVEEVPARTAKTRSKNSGTRTKLANFNPDEDKNLVKSWLEISCGPMTSTGQKRDRMWDRIIKRYNSRRASNPERSLRSLQSRWDTIRAEVTLFASYYADTIRENPSGMSDADKTTHALGNFAAVLQHKFRFLHCWELMKDAPKWQDPNARDIATAARGEGVGEESTAGTDTMDHAEGQSSPVRSGAPEGFQPAEIPEASVHHSEADVEEVPARTAKTRSKNSGTRIKLANFNPDEDKNLVKSWLDISCDPMTSTGQKKDRMWDRIVKRYNSRRASNPERSLRSLQSRWDTIRAEVTLFASYYADTIRENPSGVLHTDKTTHAAGNFAAVLQRTFRFLHCWELMKDAPKWQDSNTRDIATAARGEGFGEESTAGIDTVDHAEGQSSPVRSGAPEGFQLAEIPEASVHHSEADVEEVPACAKTRSKNSGTRTKLANFNPDEDKNLVKSWLEISCDPMSSTGQKRDRMWDRIVKQYNSRRASNPERSLRSLQSRWDTISAEVTLLASYYADTIRENPSGMSDADKTTHAVGNFATVLQRKFRFLHCWELMKDAPKWQDIATAARGEGFGEESTAGTDTVDHAEGQSSPVQSRAQARRPMGRDSAKAAKKKANSDAGSTSSAEYAARMQDLSLKTISFMQAEAVRKNDRFQQLASINEKRFEEMRRHNEALIQIEQEKIRLMREQHEDERRKEERKEDERILKIDLDACAPSLRLYYQTRQEEILERQAARRQRSQVL